MTLTYPLSLPTLKGWVTKRFELAQNRTTFGSGLDQSRQVLIRPGGFFVFKGQPPLMRGTDAREWRGFIHGLRGGAGTFELPVPDYDGPTNGSATNGLVKGASQTGNEIACDGFPVSQTPLLYAGEYLRIENQLYILTKDATTDGGGNVTFDVDPPIRVSPADNAAVEVLAPTCLMRLIEGLSGWDTDKAGNYQFDIAAFEDVI